MKVKIVDAGVLRSLSPQGVTAWLRARGWHLRETVPDRFFRVQKTIDGTEWEVEVPFSSSLRDYARRMAELLDVVEDAEGIDQPALTRAMSQALTDVVRVRVDSEMTRGGRIPIDQGAALYGHTRDLLLAAACATVEPREAYRSRKPTRAMDYLGGLRYGPPEVGSYVVTVESPVPPELQPPLLDPPPTQDLPFERRVVLTLGHALRAARHAASAAAVTSDITPFVDAVPLGLTANLCDAVAGLLEPFDAARLDIGIGFASSRPARVDPVRVTFDAESAPVLREAARIFKEREPLSDFSVEGVVVKLDSTEPEAGGTAVIFCAVEGQSRKVKVSLDARDYALAIKAHGESHAVSIEGELIRERSGHTLRGARNLRLIDDA